MRKFLRSLFRRHVLPETVAEYAKRNPEWLKRGKCYLRVRLPSGADMMICPYDISWSMPVETFRRVANYEVIEEVPMIEE